MKSIITHPIQFRGRTVAFRLNYDNRDVVKSWDILFRNVVLNKTTEEHRRSLGFSEEDMELLNERASIIVMAQEGRINGSSGYA
jgi:hypothetical protein